MYLTPHPQEIKFPISSPLKAWRRWILRAAGLRELSAAALLIAVIHFYLASAPTGITDDQRGYMKGAWAVLGLAWLMVWVVRRAIIMYYHPPADLVPLRRWRWVVPPMIGAINWALLGLGVPFLMVVLISRPAMDRMAQRLMAQPPAYTHADRRLGVFGATTIVAGPDYAAFVLPPPVPTRGDAVLMLYMPHAAPRSHFHPGLPLKDPRALGGHWYAVNIWPQNDLVYAHRQSLRQAAAEHPDATWLPMLMESIVDPYWRKSFYKSPRGYGHYQAGGYRPWNDTWGNVPEDGAFGEPLRPDMLAVIRLGPAAIPAIQPLLSSSEPWDRLNACVMLGRIAEIWPAMAAAVAPDLIRLASADAEAAVREVAVYSLGQLRPAPPAGVVPALVKAMDDADLYVSLNAAVALVSLAPTADQALQPVIAHLQQLPATRKSATAPGRTIDTSQRIELARQGYSEDDKAQVNHMRWLIYLLGTWGRDAVSASDALAALLVTPPDAVLPPPPTGTIEPGHRREIAQLAHRLLVRLGPLASDAVPRLLAAIDPDQGGAIEPQERDSVRTALAAVGPGDQRVIDLAERQWLRAREQLLEEPAHDWSKGNPSQAADFWLGLLAQHDPANARVIQALLDDLAADRWYDLPPARQLARLKPPADKTVPLLLAQLQSESWSRWYQACDALASLGPDAAPAAPLLLALARDPQQKPDRRWVAMRTLARLGPAGHDVLPLLLEHLDLADPRARDALHALSQMGPRDEAATREVASLLQRISALPKDSSNTWETKSYAIKALAALAAGGKQQDAVNALRVLLVTEKNLTQRTLAIQALRQIEAHEPERVEEVQYLLQFDVRNQEVWARLGRLHPPPTQVLDDAWKALLIQDPLRSMVPDHWAAVDALIAARHTSDTELMSHFDGLNTFGARYWAAVELGAHGPAAQAALPLLIQRRYGDSRREVRDAAASAIAQISSAAPHVPAGENAP
ncbi:MAG: HEAT repeat domain-containing protein [Phycisphaeraceae bacterium]